MAEKVKIGIAKKYTVEGDLLNYWYILNIKKKTARIESKKIWKLILSYYKK